MLLGVNTRKQKAVKLIGEYVYWKTWQNYMALSILFVVFLFVVHYKLKYSCISGIFTTVIHLESVASKITTGRCLLLPSSIIHMKRLVENINAPSIT
jgi:hypothetical protein